MNLTIINPPATLWDTKSDTAKEALQTYGYSRYFDGVDQYIYVIANSDGTFKDQETISGYTWQKNIKAFAGFSDTGITVDWAQGDEGLLAVSAALNIPSLATHAQLIAIDWDSIDENIIRATIKNGIITDFAVQPYENVTFNGEVVKYNGEAATYLKTALL